MKKFEVWSEGYRATGESAGAQFHGEAMAENFIEACEKVLGDSIDREPRVEN